MSQRLLREPERRRMEILDYIPTGKRNAVTRTQLCIRTGLSDRLVRKAIHDARRKIPIINLSNGDGYYIPDMNIPEEQNELLHFVRQEQSRIKSTGWALTTARRTLKNCGVSL